MKEKLGISISCGILAGVWMLIADQFNLNAWPAFVGWTLFFFAGANIEGCKKSFPGIVLGAVLGWATVYTQISLQTTGLVSAFTVAILAFIMTIAPSLKLFPVGGAIFLGCAIYFATGSLFDAIAIPSAGLVLGTMCIPLGATFDKVILRDSELVKG